MFTKFRLTLLLACLPLAACTMSPIPITAATPQAPDDGFAGKWRSEIAGQSASIFSISPAAEGRLTAEVWDEGESQPKPERLQLVTARIAGKNYLSVTFILEKDVPPQYLLLRYEPVSPRKIQIYIADYDLLADAVSQRWISGQLVKDRHMDSFQLSGDAAQLRDFIAAHGERVFHAKGPVLERIPE